jgi:1,4-dihydroxy-2-naphthoate octaprenyltransferase
MDADRQVGKRTLAVRLGEARATDIAAVCAVAAVLAALGVDWAGWVPDAFTAVWPWMAAHAMVLLGLLYARPSHTRGDHLSIICALTFIMWFVAAPLWHWW